MSRAELFRVRAVNTASDSENRIHDDAVAAAHGFRGGLVPGVTVYGYMMAPVIEHFGEEWLERGSVRVRFKEPVYEDEEIGVEIVSTPSGQAEVSLEQGRAMALAWMQRDVAEPDPSGFGVRPLPEPAQRPAASTETLAVGTVLGTLTPTMNLAESKMSRPLPAAIGSNRLAHPAILLALANDLLVRNFVLGPWIHVSSEVTNFDSVRDGDGLEVRGRVIGQYERKGHEFVVVDALLIRGRHAVMHVRHTAIWKLRTTA